MSDMQELIENAGKVFDSQFTYHEDVQTINKQSMALLGEKAALFRCAMVYHLVLFMLAEEGNQEITDLNRHARLSLCTVAYGLITAAWQLMLLGHYAGAAALLRPIREATYRTKAVAYDSKWAQKWQDGEEINLEDVRQVFTKNLKDIDKKLGKQYERYDQDSIKFEHNLTHVSKNVIEVINRPTSGSRAELVAGPFFKGKSCTHLSFVLIHKTMVSLWVVSEALSKYNPRAEELKEDIRQLIRESGEVLNKWACQFGQGE